MSDGELYPCKVCGESTPHTLSVYFTEEGDKEVKVKVMKCELCHTEKVETKHVMDLPVLN